MKYALLIGAKSDIAIALAKNLATAGYQLYLVARNIDDLIPLSKDLKIRHNTTVVLKELDVEDTNSHQNFYNSLPIKPELVVTLAGYLGDQNQAQNNWDETHRIINVNFTGLVSLLNIIANDFEQSSRNNQTIVGVSSVAGDRGRQSNYIYGSSKAAFSAYLSGLRNRLTKSKISVITIKPGFVATKMTAGLPLPKPLTITAEQAANSILKAIKKKKSVVYTKWIWFYIMTIIKHIPEFIFKKLNL